MSTTPRERPILFSGPMVRAILEGRKTQTRRVAKPPPKAVFLPDDQWKIDVDEPGTAYMDDESGRLRITCPYGQPGDRLWVRETWKTCDGIYVPGVEFTDGSRAFPEFDDLHAMPSDHQDYSRKRSPIYMPRWASRITLEITRVRVELLHSITAEDCIAEGAPFGLAMTTRREVIDWYRDMWVKVNGRESADANPWVWVIDFERIKP